MSGPRCSGKLPRGVERYDSSTASGLLIGRTQTNGKPDYEAVHKFQDGVKVVPLSAWGNGQPFDSSKRYLLHFDKNQIPPTRAFWSLTMYNERQIFAANPINRYAIGDRDKLAFNSDGSLDLYIQRESPGKEKESNWLPAPASGAFTMNLRLYWPKAEVLNGSWVPPPVKKVN
jgi:hypothetical protein